MLSTQRERENFYRISTIIVDHGKESLILLLDNELNTSNQTLEDFINLNQHEIYHLCFNRYTCCQCINGRLPLTTPPSRVLHPDQLNVLLDKNGQQLSCHNIKSSLQFYCCPAKTTLTPKHLDLTLLRCLLINFATICPQNSSIRLVVDDLVGYRNKLYGHAEEARCSDTDYILYKNQIEKVILTIAKSCKKESEMKQKLKDTEVRPLDETICQQYQICLLHDIQQNEDIRMEINNLREQSKQNNDQIVQHILEITTNISSHNKTITEKMEGMQLDFDKRDEILYERIQSNEVKLNDEVYKQNKEVMRTIGKEREVLQLNHEELIGHLNQTELNIRSTTEEKTESILTHVEQTRQEIKDKIDNISVDLKEKVTIEVAKLGILDLRKQNLIDHSIARIKSHRGDETFVETFALDKGKNVLKEQNLVIIRGKGGSGKTQIALHLASVYQDEGYIPLFFSDKEVIKYRDLISLTDKNIVIVEDLFGRTSVDFYEDYHRNILDILLSCLKTSTLLKMVFTIRNDPTCEESILAKHDIFHQKCILNLDYDYSLSDKERITILLSHMRYNAISPCKSKLKIDVCFDYDPLPGCSSECTANVQQLPCGKIQICTDTIYTCCMSDTYVGFPETCRMFCCDKSLTCLGVSYFRNTNKSLINKINDLFSESFEKLSCRYQYSVLVYTALKHNFFDNNIIESHIENDQLFKRIFSLFDNRETKIRKTLVQQAIRSLEGGYLINSSRYNEFYLDNCPDTLGKAYMFKHQAVHDAVLVSFGNECPEMLMNLDICELQFILQYIRPSLKQPDPKSSVIHVDPKLVIDKLCYFLEKDFLLSHCEMFKLVGISHPWFPPRIEGQDEEDDYQEQCKFDESDKSEYTDDVKSLLDLQKEDPGSDQSTHDGNSLLDLQAEDPGSDDSADDAKSLSDLQAEDAGSDRSDTEEENDICEFAYQIIRGCPEMIGEYIRNCIIERRYVSFVKIFLERLSKLPPQPEQMTKFLNGLTRRGTCLMNLKINSDIIRDCAFKYADINVFCLIFRPESSTIKHYKFYQLDDTSLQVKLISIIDENKTYKTMAEIGNFLYRIGVDEGNYEFVNRFLDSILDTYRSKENHCKIRYIIDGISAKGRRTDVVSRFIEFMQTNLLTYGSIKTIIGLWEVINTEIYKTDKNTASLMVILEEKFEEHILFGTDFEDGVNYKAQTQEYGACVYNLGMKVQNNKCIEQLLLKLNETYELLIKCAFFIGSPNSLHFLIYFYKGFTNFRARKNDAEQMCPSGMEKLYCHIKRYKTFFKKVKETIRCTNSSGEYAIPFSWYFSLASKDKLNSKTSEDDVHDGN
ncbi:uncharacterized protein LOC127704660 [Mytilus californianus]|uniref:uncharacterized protein LOC127704660 n=1 Tax=Mytilus californianus TaxID=6549 RepID=UPI002247BB2D|nr:uncharacterized protein LOC127704660 [Mytilus californianus]